MVQCCYNRHHANRQVLIMAGGSRLTNAQLRAIRHIREYAVSRRREARQSIAEVLRMSDIPQRTYEAAVANMLSNARVAVHFHPDRPLADGKRVAQALLEQGIYKSQFETRISNGGVSAYPGGARDLWEKTLFGGAYQSAGAAMAERPKYGALDLMLHADGPAPRFGSCYLLLSPDVSSRCTFTYGGSQDDPPGRGTLDEFEGILALLLRDLFEREYAIGAREMTPPRFIDHLCRELVRPWGDPTRRHLSRNLNHYIEVQIHGDISLKHDADMLVADPSFQGTAVGYTLKKLGSAYDIELLWHRGFTMRADEVPANYRGPGMPGLACRIANRGRIDACTIGEAVHALKRCPGHWSDRGTYDEVLQELKYIWHVLVRYGEPLR